MQCHRNRDSLQAYFGNWPNETFKASAGCMLHDPRLLSILHMVQACKMINLKQKPAVTKSHAPL